MGSITVFLMYYMLKLLMTPILIRLRKKFKVTRKFFHRLIRKLFYKEIHTIFIEGYMEFLISIYFNFLHPLYSTNGEIAGFIFSILCIIGTSIFIPLSFLYTIRKPLETFKYRHVESVWGALYEGVKTKNIY